MGKKQQKTDSRLKMENKFAAKFYFHHSVSTGINTAEENTHSYCTGDCNYCSFSDITDLWCRHT